VNREEKMAVLNNTLRELESKGVTCCKQVEFIGPCCSGKYGIAASAAIRPCSWMSVSDEELYHNDEEQLKGLAKLRLKAALWKIRELADESLQRLEELK